MKIYFATVAFKEILVNKRILYSYAPIQIPILRYGAKSDFNKFINTIQNGNKSGKA